jgi:hypothetical protein
MTVTNRSIRVFAASALATLAACTFGRTAAAGGINDNCTNNGGSCVSANNNGSGSGTTGVSAQTTANTAIYGMDTSDGIGVWGQATGGLGVYGYDTSNGTGVQGLSFSGGTGVEGQGETGVEGIGSATSGAIGVSGSTSNSGGIGGYFTSGSGTSAIGVKGTSSGGTGVYGTSNAAGQSAVFGQNTAAGNGVYGKASGTGSYAVYADGNLSATGCFSVNGTNYYNCSSDERLKKNIEPVRGALATLLQLRGVTYEWKNPEEQGKNQTGTQTGFIAQEVEKAFPKWVGENSEGFKTLNIDPRAALALMVESIRDLKTENEALRADIEALKAARRPSITMNANLGIGLAGLVIGGAIFVTRRKREA